MTFIVGEDPTSLGNGDVSVKTDKGRLVALVYANADTSPALDVAQVVAAALNAAFCPSHTDMMVAPEQLDKLLDDNPLPSYGENDLLEKLREVQAEWEKLPAGEHQSEVSRRLSEVAHGIQQLQRMGDHFWPRPA